MIRIKPLLNILLCLIFICGIAACGNKKSAKANDQEDFASTLTTADTTAVLTLTTQCMDLLKGNKIEEALQMMYVMVDGKPIQVSGGLRQKLNSKFKMFPVLEYTIDDYYFTSETDNIVKYKIEFFARLDKNDKTPNTIGFMFVPIRIEGKWYLTIPETN